MKRLPGAIFIVDPHRERIAVTEANKLEIPVVGTGDTNVDPDELDYIIPANDDAIRAIRLLCAAVADAAIEGAQQRSARASRAGGRGGPWPRDRGRRAAARPTGSRRSPAVPPCRSSRMSTTTTCCPGIGRARRARPSRKDRRRGGRARGHRRANWPRPREAADARPPARVDPTRRPTTARRTAQRRRRDKENDGHGGSPPKLVKELRERTGAGFMDCKKALTETDGDLEKATTLLRERASRRRRRRPAAIAREGLIGTYIHTGGRFGALIEVNCETDFVARNEQFQQLVKDLAIQVVALKPLYPTIESSRPTCSTPSAPSS